MQVNPGCLQSEIPVNTAYYRLPKNKKSRPLRGFQSAVFRLGLLVFAVIRANFFIFFRDDANFTQFTAMQTVIKNTGFLHSILRGLVPVDGTCRRQSELFTLF
jgi:hypothetical protein